MIGKKNSAHPTHTGQLLANAGIITQANLNEALSLAKKACMPLGRVLLMSGSVTETELSSTLTAQRLMREGVLPQDYAINVLKVALRGAIPFEEALRRQGWKPQSHKPSNEVGELLVGINLISSDELACAIERMHHHRLPLGRVLVADGLVKPYELVSALTAAVLVKRNEIEQDEALEVLKNACLKRISFDQAYSQRYPDQQGPTYYPKLGELLGQAGLVCESDVIDAIELGLSSNELVGEILVQKGRISRATLHSALDVQELIGQNVISANQAADILKKVHEGKGTLVDCMRELERYSDAVLNMLEDAGYVTADDIKVAAARSVGQIVDLPEVLFETGFVEKAVVDMARRCQKLVDEGLMPREQAVPVLRAYRKEEEPQQGKKTTDTWDIELESVSAA